MEPYMVLQRDQDEEEISKIKHLFMEVCAIEKLTWQRRSDDNY